MMSEVEREKNRVREEVRSSRGALSQVEVESARDGVAARVIDLVARLGARSVSCYLPVPGEPDTTTFLKWAHDSGIEVLLPSAREDGLLDWIRASGAETVRGRFGIPEPIGDPLGPHAVSDVDLMLVPAAAVDRRGVRLGWGRGYFDRNLGSMRCQPPVYAIVHESEFVEKLPREAHDMPVDGVVTPERIIQIVTGERSESQ